MNTIMERVKKKQFVLIAEIGVNYYDIARDMGISNLDAAKLMCSKAKEAGIHAVKFQTYKAETLAAHNSPAYWDLSEESTVNQRELFHKYDSFGYEEYKEIKHHCDRIGIEFLSTAFDYEAADYLDELMNIYKISSSDITNIPFVEYQAKKNKPILLSTGASNKDEIDAAIAAIRKYNEMPIVLMHCVLEYPTPHEHANLAKIRALKREYPNFIIGYSDHTKMDQSCDVQKTAVALGARVIEKHYTLNKSLPGNDHYHAMDSEDAVCILKNVRKIEELMGSDNIVCIESEQIARKNARRSIVSKCEIPKGTTINADMLTAKRPGTGISPVKEYELVGRKSLVDIAEDEIIQMDWVE